MYINFRGVWNSLSYGVCGKNILRELDNAGHSVSFFPIANPQVDHQEDIPLLNKLLHGQDNFNSNATCINLWHQHSLAERIGKGTLCGFPIFELDTLTDREKHHINNLDIVCVTSEWARNVLISNGINIPIRKVPLGVNTSIFYPNIKTTSSNKTIFLNIGKLELRKGHDVLLDIFNQAFDEYDDVELWMLTNNPFLNQEQTKSWIDYYLDSPLGNKIKFLPPVRTQEEVAAIINQVDCGVFPSRAEGWNLGALEMLACAKPVIITNYSAHTEFYDDKNSMLINIEETETAHDGIWFHGNGNWANIGVNQIEQAANYMKKVHENRRCKNNLFLYNQAGLDTANKFTWTNTADCLINAIS